MCADEPGPADPREDVKLKGTLETMSETEHLSQVPTPTGTYGKAKRCRKIQPYGRVPWNIRELYLLLARAKED